MRDRRKLLNQLISDLRTWHPWIERRGQWLYTHPVVGLSVTGLSFAPSSLGRDEVYVEPFIHMPRPPGQGWGVPYGKRLKWGRGFDFWALADQERYDELMTTLRDQTLVEVSRYAHDEHAVEKVIKDASEIGNYRYWNDAAMLNVMLSRADEAWRCLEASERFLSARLRYQKDEVWIEDDEWRKELVKALGESLQTAKDLIMTYRDEDHSRPHNLR